jgi:septal ring factor EnvC (AmiA/AmiB activator)
MFQALLSRSRLLMSFAVAGSILLTGCASTGSTMTGNSPDPRLTQGSTAEFFSKSGYQACAVAAGAGVLACALSNSGNKAACAVVAGLAACGVAMGANYYLDQRRSQYSNTTERLQVMTKDVQADTDKVVARTAVAQQVINDDQQSIAKIKRDIAAKTVDKTKAAAELASIDENIAVLKKDLGNMRSKVTEYTKVADAERAQGNSAEIKQVDINILKMNEKVASLQKEVDGLYNQRNAITLG